MLLKTWAKKEGKIEKNSMAPHNAYASWIYVYMVSVDSARKLMTCYGRLDSGGFSRFAPLRG
jgi:hypothetical protein